MSSQDFLNQATKLGALLETIGKAKAVLQAAADAENGAKALREEAKRARKDAETAASEREAALAALSAQSEKLAAARALAAEVTAAAQRRANELIAEAQERSAKLLTAAEEEVRRTRATLEGLEGQIADAAARREQVAAQADAEQKRLEKILAEARSRFA